jgi:hypothetical protein
MFKGLLVCYAVIIMTFFSVAISGYWAFGNQTKGVILINFMVDEKPLLPTWVLLMTNVLTLLQVAAVSVVRSSLLLARNGSQWRPVLFWMIMSLDTWVLLCHTDF